MEIDNTKASLYSIGITLFQRVVRMVGTTNIHLVCTSDTPIMEPSEIVEVVNPRRLQGVKNKEIVRGSIPSTKILGVRKRIFARRMARDSLEIH
jgi:hypothetical protein